MLFEPLTTIRLLLAVLGGQITTWAVERFLAAAFQ